MVDLAQLREALCLDPPSGPTPVPATTYVGIDPARDRTGNGELQVTCFIKNTSIPLYVGDLITVESWSDKIYQITCLTLQDLGAHDSPIQLQVTAHEIVPILNAGPHNIRELGNYVTLHRIDYRQEHEHTSVMVGIDGQIHHGLKARR